MAKIIVGGEVIMYDFAENVLRVVCGFYCAGFKDFKVVED